MNSSRDVSNQELVVIKAMNYLRYNHAPNMLHKDKHPYATNFLAFTAIKCKRKTPNQWCIYIDDDELIKRAKVNYQAIINENPKYENTYKWFDKAVVPTARFIAEKYGGKADA